jgi:type II secretory pathway pseudopilin PulG
LKLRDDAGESLIEVVMAMLVLGGAIAALLASVTTAVNSSRTHRNLVRTDTVMRNYAEAIKVAVRDGCDGGTSGGNYAVSYSAPDFSFATSDPTNACPAAGAPIELVLSVSGPAGTKSMQIVVRRP